MQKKGLILSLVLAMSLALGACQKQEQKQEAQESKEPAQIKVMALKGPTSMGLAKLIDESKKEDSKSPYKITIASAPDQVVGAVAKGETDIATVPSNMASILYNKTKGKIQVATINTLGVLYIVENGDSVKSLADLKGKTVFASGKDATPEFMFRYLLTKNGINPDKDLTIEWKSEHSELVSALAAEKGAIAVMPQPFVTVAQMKVKGLNVPISFNDEWAKLNKDGAQIVTGVTIVNKEFAEKNKAAFDKFLEDYKASIDFVNKDTDAAAKIIGDAGIVKAPIAKKAMPFCNITYIDGDKMKSDLTAYLTILKDMNPKSIGGKLPGDDFYYKK